MKTAENTVALVLAILILTGATIAVGYPLQKDAPKAPKQPPAKTSPEPILDISVFVVETEHGELTVRCHEVGARVDMTGEAGLSVFLRSPSIDKAIQIIPGEKGLDVQMWADGTTCIADHIQIRRKGKLVYEVDLHPSETNGP